VNRAAWLLFSLTISCARAAQRTSESATVAAITDEDLERRLRIIADDSMMGRESGSDGDYKAAEYVAAEFRRLGLEPAGENGTYFQTVPLWTVGVDRSSRLDVGGVALRLGRDFLPNTVGVTARQLENVEVVYGGAMGSPTTLDGSAARGKLVVFLPPNAPTNMGAFLGAYSDARAIAIATLDRLGPETIARLLEGRPTPDTTTNAARVFGILVTTAAATNLLGAAPETLTPGPTGRRVNGMLGFRYTPVRFPARNVIAILRGSDPSLRGEYVSLTPTTITSASIIFR
jgi:hypothetical protein